MEHERRRSGGRHDDRHDTHQGAGGSAIPARERAWLDSLREADGDHLAWAVPQARPASVAAAAPAVAPEPAVPPSHAVDPLADPFIGGPIGDPLTGPFLSSPSAGIPAARPHLPAPAVWPGGVPAPVVVSPSWTPPPAPTPAPPAPTAPAPRTPSPLSAPMSAQTPPATSAYGPGVAPDPAPVRGPAPVTSVPEQESPSRGAAVAPAPPAPAARPLSRREARLRETAGRDAVPAAPHVPAAPPRSGALPAYLPGSGALPGTGGLSVSGPASWASTGPQDFDPFPVPAPDDAYAGPRSQRLREERLPAARRQVPVQRRPVGSATAALRRKALFAAALVVTLVCTVMAMNNQRTVEFVNPAKENTPATVGAPTGAQTPITLDRRLPAGGDQAGGPTRRAVRPVPLTPGTPAPGTLTPSDGSPSGGAPSGSSRPGAPGGTNPAPAPAPTSTRPGSLPTIRNAAVPFPTRCAVSATLVPSCGAYWGIYSRQAPDRNVQAAVTGWESKMGRNFDIVLMYYDFSNRPGPGQFPDTSMRALGDKRIPLYSWETRDFRSGAHHRWADVAAGKFDASVIVPQAQRLKAYGRTVMLGLDHEQDLTHAKHGTAAEYRAMYRHVREVFAAQGVTNVVWVWATSGYLGDGTGAHVKSFYPGDDLVDWIGYDPYNFNSCHKGPWKTFEKTISRFYTWSAQNGLGNKPLLLQEYGLRADPNDSAKSQQWYRDIPSVLPRYPRLKALVRWDSDTSCPLRIDSQPGMASAFRDAGLGVQRP